MIQTTLKLAGWTVASGLALTAIFYPGAGLIESGPGAAAAAGLLGAAMCVHTRRRRIDRDDRDERK